MRFALLVLVLLGACAHCPTDADVERMHRDVAVSNTRRVEQALADGMRQHALTDLADLVYATEAIEGESPPEGIAEVNGKVLLVVASYGGGSCDSRAPWFLKMARDHDGKVVIVRMNIEWGYRTIKKCGSCGYGCGVPSPPVPGAVYELPAKTLDDVAGFVDLSVHQDIVSVDCDKPIPMP